jgi:hypothetical protein
MAAGDVTTLGVKAFTAGAMNVELLDGAGSVLATGVGGSTSLDSVIGNFQVPAAGTYYARVSGGRSLAYDLVVTRNAAFDTEPNDSGAAAQPLFGDHGALGALVGSGIYAASAVPFGFEDISATGTVIAGLTGVDDVSVSIPVGFNFPFYGTSHTSVFVSSNGLLTFSTGNTAFTNADLTASPAQAAIAAFWDDLHTGGGAAGSNVYFQVLGSGPGQHLTIQWNQVRFFTGGTAGDTITFQAQLYADGRVQLNYLDLVSGAAAGNNGASASVGIKAAGTQGPDRLLLAFNNGPNAFVGTGQTTSIAQLPSDDWYRVALGAGQTSLQYETSTPADGPGEFVNTLNPALEIYDSANNLVASGTPLGDGRNEVATATGLGSGDYRIRLAAEGGSSGEYFLGSGCTLVCPANVTVSNDPGVCGAAVTYAPATTIGSCGSLTYSVASGSTFPVGTTTVVATATRADGGNAACSFDVTVNDTQPPAPGPVTASPRMLWPPNHTMRNVSVDYNPTDNCPGVSCVVSGVTSNEPVNGTGDGDTAPDWEIVDAHHVRLRAERAGTGSGRIYTITVTCTDASGNTASRTTEVVVAHNIGSPRSGSSFRIGTPVSFAGTFWDVPGRTHTAQWVFDGTAAVAGTVVEPRGLTNGTVSGSYTFGTPGVYKVAMKVTDNTGAISSVDTNGDVEALVVVYDPNGGYTVGGGWLTAPPGSYAGNASLTGKLGFGFNVKYTNAANPKGETQASFRLGSLDFNALNYNYLAISGAKAQFKGFGKVNGDAGYNFLLTVIDGQATGGGGVDRLRLKIWNKTTGAVVFDTQRGASDAADPTTPVGEGSSIVIQR